MIDDFWKYCVFYLNLLQEKGKLTFELCFFFLIPSKLNYSNNISSHNNLNCPHKLFNKNILNNIPERYLSKINAENEAIKLNCLYCLKLFEIGGQTNCYKQSRKHYNFQYIKIFGCKKNCYKIAKRAKQQALPVIKLDKFWNDNLGKISLKFMTFMSLQQLCGVIPNIFHLLVMFWCPSTW